MSSKKKKSEGRSGDSVEQAAEIFQAVILSDSFNFRFLPITLETPRVSLFWLFFIITYFLNLKSGNRCHDSCLSCNSKTDHSLLRLIVYLVRLYR